MQTLHRFSAPTAEPISILEAKVMLTLAVDLADAAALTELDGEVMAAIAGAREAAEIETGKTIVYTGYDLYIDQWPRSRCIKLPVPPVRMIQSITYWDKDGAEFVFGDWTGDLFAFSPKVVLDADASWPTVELRSVNPIRVRYRAGMVVPFSMNATTNVITVPGNPFAEGDVVRLSVSGGLLPVGLVASRDYYIRDVVADNFSLAATYGGAAIDVTTTGTGTLFIGEVEASVMTGFRMMTTGLFENIRDSRQATHDKYTKAASHWFRMDSVRGA